MAGRAGAAGLDDTLHFHDLRAEAACRLYEATNGDARRVMHFLDHRSLDETQKYLDRLTAHTEQENAQVMAEYEQASGTQGATVGATVTAFRRKRA